MLDKFTEMVVREVARTNRSAYRERKRVPTRITMRGHLADPLWLCEGEDITEIEDQSEHQDMIEDMKEVIPYIDREEDLSRQCDKPACTWPPENKSSTDYRV